MFLAGGQNQCDNCDLSVLWKGTMMCDCQIDQNGTVVVNGELEDDNVNKTDIKAPEESAKAELGRNFISILLNQTNDQSIRMFIQRLDITCLCLLQKRTPGRASKWLSSPSV